jgi:hypothetical protein
MTMKNLLIALVFLTYLAGCSGQQVAVRMASPLIQGQYQALNEEADPILAEQAIPANLKMLEGMLKSDDGNVRVLHNLAEGFCGYAFGFVEDKEPQRASALYLRGRNYASRSLSLELTTLDMEAYKAALTRFDSSYLPGLYWLGQCWSGWLLLNLDNPSALTDIPRVEMLLVRMAELDESWHYAGPHLLLGGFYGSRTRILGGNPQKSIFHFERNLTLTANKFLMTLVLFAKTYAVQAQDREMFERLLHEVLKTPAEILPEQRLVNEIAKIKAKKLLESIDDLF